MSKQRTTSAPRKRAAAKRPSGRRESPSARRPPRRRDKAVPQRVVYGPRGLELVNLAPSTGVGYQSVQEARASGRPTLLGGSADRHLQWDHADMRAQSQEFDRDNGIYGAMITRVIDVILGSGVSLQAKTKSKSKTKSKTVNTKLQKLWGEFWDRPEVRGLDTGKAVERLILRHFFVDGDHLIHKLAGKENKPDRIQLVEGERIIDPTDKPTADGIRVVHGVEMDRVGKPLRFHVAEYDDFEQVTLSKTTPIQAGDAIYLANRQRVSQTRGTPVQQSNFAMFHRINDVCDSEAIAWQLLSRMALIINKKDASQIADETSTAVSGVSDQDLAAQWHDLPEGLLFFGEAGEEVKAVDRTIPGANFPDSLKMFLRLLGLPFGFSLEFVLLIWSDTNYSSGRASIKQVERACKPWIELLGWALSEIYTWQVARWVKAGKVPNREDIAEHVWHFNPYPFLDPAKEAQAQRERLEIGNSSPTQESKAGGRDHIDLVAEQEADLGVICEAVKRLNEKYQTDFTAADFTAFVEPRQKRSGGNGDTIEPVPAAGGRR